MWSWSVLERISTQHSDLLGHSEIHAQHLDTDQCLRSQIFSDCLWEFTNSWNRRSWFSEKSLCQDTRVMMRTGYFYLDAQVQTKNLLHSIWTDSWRMGFVAHKSRNPVLLSQTLMSRTPTSISSLVSLIADASHSLESYYTAHPTEPHVPSLDDTEPHPLDNMFYPSDVREAAQTLEGACAQLCATLLRPSHFVLNVSSPQFWAMRNDPMPSNDQRHLNVCVHVFSVEIMDWLVAVIGLSDGFPRRRFTSWSGEYSI